MARSSITCGRRILTDRSRTSRVAFLTSLSGLFAATVVSEANASGGPRMPVAVALPERSAVRAIRIAHLSDDLESDPAIGPANFSGHPGIKMRTIVAPSTVSAALGALHASFPRRSRVYPDCRWELALLDAHDVPLFVVYADRFVSDGSIGAYGVTFTHGESLRAFLHAHDPLT